MTTYAGWIYGIQCGPYIKIGIAGHPWNRLKQLQTGNPYPLKLVLRSQLVDYAWLEKRMHKLLAQHAIGGEWFEIDAKLARETLDRARKERAVLAERARKRAEEKRKPLQSKDNSRNGTPLVRERSSVQS